jgi:7-carboxy-7-deazaguanine synthase
MPYKKYTLFFRARGVKAGSSAVFCRVSGCNLRAGFKRDRARAACRFCDTDFVDSNGIGGGKYLSAASLSNTVDDSWPDGCSTLLQD